VSALYPNALMKKPWPQRYALAAQAQELGMGYE